MNSLYFYVKQTTFLGGFRKRGAEKRARPTGAFVQPIRRKFSSEFLQKTTYLSQLLRKRGAEKRARPTWASGQPMRKNFSPLEREIECP